MFHAFTQVVAMNLVGNHEYIMFCTNFRNFFQLFFGPYAADRVCRRAEDQHSVVWICAFFFQISKVNGVVTVVVDQVVGNCFAVPFGFDRRGEVTVNRTHNDDAVTLVGEEFYCMLQRTEGTVGAGYFVRRNDPVMTIFEPTAERFCVFRVCVRNGVTVHHVVSNAVHRFNNRLWRLQVHISNHHWDGIFINIDIGHAFFHACETIPFGRISTMTVNDFVEIVFHTENLFY